MKDDTIDSKERGEIAGDEFIVRFTAENTKLNYYDTIKWKPLKLFGKKTTTKKHSAAQEKLDLRKIMDYCVTSKSWAIVNEDEKSRNNNRHQFQNQLQNLTPIPKIHNAATTIDISFKTSYKI